jgi:hypothetical protein
MDSLELLMMTPYLSLPSLRFFLAQCRILRQKKTFHCTSGDLLQSSAWSLACWQQRNLRRRGGATLLLLTKQPGADRYDKKRYLHSAHVSSPNCILYAGVRNFLQALNVRLQGWLGQPHQRLVAGFGGLGECAGIAGSKMAGQVVAPATRPATSHS